jgi:GTP pyrophosphokinase
MATTLSYRFVTAVERAVRYHERAVRKGTNIPYLSHVLAVSAIALEHGATETEAIAALLHDAVEDAGGRDTRDIIAGEFGEDVAAIVDGCTDDSPAPGAAKRDWAERKREYIAHVADVAPAILLVSASDKLHNSRAILDDYRSHGDQVWTRFNATPGNIIWYYQSLAGAYRARVAALAQAGQVSQERHMALKQLLAKLARTISDLVEESGIPPAPPPANQSDR